MYPRYRNDCHDGRSLYSQIPRNKRHGMTHRAAQGNTRVSQATEQGETWVRVFIVVFMGKNGQGRVSRIDKFRIG